MSKIVMSGYYGFANAGDEAMLTAIVKALRNAEKTVALTVISGNPKVTSARHNVSSIHRFKFWQIMSAIRQADLLVSGGGSLLQDVTSKRSLCYYLTVLAMGIFFQKKVMLYGQGIGPINSGIMRKLTKFVCSHVDLITVRDRDSLYELRRLGIPQEKVRLTADAVFTLPQESGEEGARLLAQYAVPADKRLVAISVRQWQNDDSYLLELAKAADALVQKYDAHIVLLPLQYPVDAVASKQLQNYMVHKTESTVLELACDTEQFLSLMSNFDLLIGMRLHALIFAAVMELPFVAISYDPKIDGFVKDIDGISAGHVASLEARHIVEAARKAFADAEAYHIKINSFRDEALKNAQQALALLER